MRFFRAGSSAADVKTLSTLTGSVDKDELHSDHSGITNTAIREEIIY